MENHLNRAIFGSTEIASSHITEYSPNRIRRSPVMVSLDDPRITAVDIQKMMEIGLNVAKFKASHTSRGDKMRLLGKVDKAADFLCRKHAVLDWPVATCLELKTCIVKCGILKADTNYITLYEGKEVILTNDLSEFDKCTESRIFVDNSNLTVDIPVGTEISMGLDEVILRCNGKVDDKSIKCLVTKTGKLKSMDIVCARGAKRTRPLITRKDLQIVRFALEYQVDMIIISYARQADTILRIKQYMGKTVKRPIIICGICTPEGLENIDGILKESDGIMLCREFLAYELEESDRQRMTHIQKWMAAKCRQVGKPLYISGGIFRETLASGNFVDNETSDVTNALLDGATGFALLNCPEVEHVLAVIRALNELCCSVEPYTHAKADFWRIITEIKNPVNAAEACALSCAIAVNQSNARVVIIPTVTGRSAKTLLWLKPSCIIITVSTKTRATRLLQTYRSIVPLKYRGGMQKQWLHTIEARVKFAIEYAVKKGWLVYGDTYVTLQRAAEDSAFCDCVRIWNVSISKKHTVECLDGDELETSTYY